MQYNFVIYLCARMSNEGILLTSAGLRPSRVKLAGEGGREETKNQTTKLKHANTIGLRVFIRYSRSYSCFSHDLYLFANTR